MKVVKHVKEQGRITNKEYKAICDTSERTATRDLIALVSKGIFVQK
jgi:ATP-dependent DNA helicase RecG